jgi:hypothetical protein
VRAFPFGRATDHDQVVLHLRSATDSRDTIKLARQDFAKRQCRKAESRAALPPRRAPGGARTVKSTVEKRAYSSR